MNSNPIRILLVTEKWSCYYPWSPESITQHVLVNTLKSTNYQSDVLCHDEILYNENVYLDEVLTRHCEANKIDLVAFDYFRNCHNFSESVIKRFKNEGIKFACIWCDTRRPYETHKGLQGELWTEVEDNFSRMMDLNVVLDGMVDGIARNLITLFVPQDMSLYYDAKLDRITDVCFVGDFSRSVLRQQIADAIQKELPHRRSYFLDTRQLSQPRLSPKEYADVYRSSKIGINVCGNQMKSRVYEIIHSGAMLISDQNDVLDKFLRSGIDYVQFSGIDDLISKIEYLLNNETELSSIAANGHATAITKCSPQTFWDAVVRGVFFT